MSDSNAESSSSSSSTLPSSNDREESFHAPEQSEAAIAAEEAFQIEEASVEHYHFLVKHANRSMELRLAVDDTVTELKAVSVPKDEGGMAVSAQCSFR
jgi:hypothetical protein